MALRVLVAGHVTLDRYGDAWLPGGSAYYAGQAYRALGDAVRIATAGGADLPRGALAGVSPFVAPAAATTRFANEHRADGTRVQRVEAAAGPIDPAALPEGWRDADVLHLAPVLGEIDLAAWLEAVRASFVGLGVQGWVRRVEPGGGVAQPPWEPDPELLARVQAACVGEDDVRGQGTLLDVLTRSVPVVAFTHGERGCDVYASGRRTRVGVFPTRVVDPVGAGDVFSAGFFHALATGSDPADAARLGAAAASIVVEGRAGEALGRVGAAFARSSAVAVRA